MKSTDHDPATDTARWTTLTLTMTTSCTQARDPARIPDTALCRDVALFPTQEVVVYLLATPLLRCLLFLKRHSLVMPVLTLDPMLGVKAAFRCPFPCMVPPTVVWDRAPLTARRCHPWVSAHLNTVPR